jgi:hypothetical protein
MKQDKKRAVASELVASTSKFSPNGGRPSPTSMLCEKMMAKWVGLAPDGFNAGAGKRESIGKLFAVATSNLDSVLALNSVRCGP